MHVTKIGRTAYFSKLKRIFHESYFRFRSKDMHMYMRLDKEVKGRESIKLQSERSEVKWSEAEGCHIPTGFDPFDLLHTRHLL